MSDQIAILRHMTLTEVTGLRQVSADFLGLKSQCCKNLSNFYVFISSHSNRNKYYCKEINIISYV
jgi:hypothetical protein